MGHGPGGTSRRAMALAGHRGDEAALRAGLTDANAVVRASALAGLGRCTALTPADLADAAHDDDPIVRRRLADVLARHGDGLPGDVVRDRIRELLDDPDPAVVEVACFAAGEQAPGWGTITDALVRIAVEHADPLCRESAVAALGALGDPDGWPGVEHGCRDLPAVRRRAVLALVAFDRPDADALLAELAVDHDWQVRQAAEELLDR